MDETRALLDALMGPNRDKKEGVSKGGPPDFDTKTVCKHFLVGFCPHDWFAVRYAALLPCDKIHSEMMRAQLDAHPDAGKYRAEYEEDFFQYLERLTVSCDAYISRERPKCRPSGKRSEKTPPEIRAQCEELEKRYAEHLRLSEKLADESLSQSETEMKLAIAIQEELKALKVRQTIEFPGEDICDICGVKYPCGDGWDGHDKESHMRGKTHDGFAKIRSKIEELKQNRKKWLKEREQDKEWFRARKKAEEREVQKDRDKEREREKEKERREREKTKEKERLAKERAERSRSRNRQKEKEKERERGKDKDRRDDKSRHKERDRDGDRDRDRGKEKDRDDKERSKDKKRGKETSADSDDSRGRGKNRSKDSQAIKEKDKKKERDDKSKPTREQSRSRDSKRSSEEEAADTEEMEIEEEDLPAFWDFAQKRPDAMKALSAASMDRLEKWLAARVAAREKI